MTLLLSAWLTFTAPAFHADSASCFGATNPIAGQESVYVWRQRQSPTWLAMRPAMLIFPAVWTLCWPIVRAEAEPVLWAAKEVIPGAKDSVAVSDTTGWFYRLVPKVVNGLPGCPAWGYK